jgi:hypothetical protein
MRETPTLAELQKWMRWAITEPRGLEKALASPRREPKPRRLDAIVEQPPLSRVDRLDVYAEGYYARLLECLEDDFSLIRRLTGEGAFRALVADYLEAHPSRTYTAAALGRHLPRFMKTHRLGRDLPYLIDVARLEWACVESFFAANVPGLDLARLQSVPAAAWPNARFELDPSVRLLRSGWRLAEEWIKADDAGDAPPEEGREWLLVRRNSKNFRVVVEDIGPARYKALSLLAKGATLGEICERLSGEELDFNQCFREWVECGVISGIVLP